MHKVQVPKYSKEPKFTILVLVNMNKLRAIMESFFEKFGPRCSVYVCVSASHLLKSTSVIFCYLICLEIYVFVILLHTYFKLSRKRKKKLDSTFAQVKITVPVFLIKGNLKIYYATYLII